MDQYISYVYTADETAILYQLLAENTFAVKSGKYNENKQSKVMLTSLATSNMDGFEKRKLMVVGTSTNPRCFKGCKKLPASFGLIQKS